MCRIFIWTVDYFLSWSVFEPGTFGSSVRQSTTVPPGSVGTHLWLLQVFNSGVRGICGRIFIWTVDYFLSWSVPPGVLVPTSDYFRYLTLGVRGICGRIFIWTVDYFFVLIGIWTREPLDLQSHTLPLCHRGVLVGYLNQGPLDLQSHTLPLCHRGVLVPHLWLLQVFISGVRGICGRIFIWTVDYFCPDRYWTRDLWIFSPTLYHCATGGVLVPTSDYFRYLTLGSEYLW